MLLQPAEILGQSCQFIVERPLVTLCIFELNFNGVDGSGLFGLDIEENMDLTLHLALLFLQFLSNGYKFLLPKFLLVEMISNNSIGLSKFGMLHFQNLYTFAQLVDFKVEVRILLAELAVVIIPVSELSLQIIQFELIISFEFIGIFIVFDFEKLELIVLFFLKLGDCILFVADFLHVFVFVDVFLVAQFLYIVGELPVLALELPHCHFEGFVLLHDFDLVRADGFAGVVGPALIGEFAVAAVVGCPIGGLVVGEAGQLGDLGGGVLSSLHLLTYILLNLSYPFLFFISSTTWHQP